MQGLVPSSTSSEMTSFETQHLSGAKVEVLESGDLKESTDLLDRVTVRLRKKCPEKWIPGHPGKGGGHPVLYLHTCLVCPCVSWRWERVCWRQGAQ